MNELQDTQRINIGRNKYTISSILKETQDRIGNEKFFNWHICRNNCQMLTKELLVTFKVLDEHCDEEQLEVPLELKKIKKIKVDHCTPVIPVYYGNYEPDCDGNIDFFAYRECREGIPFDSLSRKDAPIVIEDGTYIIENISQEKSECS